MHPTREQEQAIEAYLTGENLRIEALAGTGKTTTLKMLVQHGSPRGGKILYTAFGKKVIEDAKAKFPRTVQVKTNHSLAWGVGRLYQEKGRLQGRLSPSDLVSHFRWSANSFPAGVDERSGAFAVIETINSFCQSASDSISVEHAYRHAQRLVRGDAQMREIVGVVTDRARAAWEEAIDPSGGLPVTHDMYLKLWALRDPYIQATTILLDEAQDANGVMIGVLQKQAHAQLVVVGDRQQQIYSWRGAVDAMDAFDFVHSTTLTQSFRFGPEIAEVANAVLIDQCERDVHLTGDPAQPGYVGHCEVPHCYLARTNAALIGQAHMLTTVYPGYRVGVVGGVDELIKLVEGAAALQRRERTQVADLAEFNDWHEVQEAAKHAAYGHLRTLVQLVDDFGAAPLRSMLERLRGNESDPDACDALLSTAHKAKGAEFSSVRLLDDFKPKGPPDDVGRYGWTPEEGNLLYVACTRAREHLDIANCEAVISSLPNGFRSTLPHAQSMSDVDGGDGFDEDDIDSWCPAMPAEGGLPVPLMEGRFTHPFIEGGLVHVEHTEDGAKVIVSAMGYPLLESTGMVAIGLRQRHWVDVRVGTAVLPMPFDALAPT